MFIPTTEKEGHSHNHDHEDLSKSIRREMNKHWNIKISTRDKIYLFFANRIKCLLCFKTWKNKSKFQKLYVQGEEKINKILDLVKITRFLNDKNIDEKFSSY